MNPESLSELIEKIAKDLVASGKAGNLTEDLIPAAEKLAVMSCLLYTSDAADE